MTKTTGLIDFTSSRCATRPQPNRRLRCLKVSLRRRLTPQFRRAVPSALIRRAFSEAETTAAATGFPHLFFPELAAEQMRRISVALGLPEEPAPAPGSVSR